MSRWTSWMQNVIDFDVSRSSWVGAGVSRLRSFFTGSFFRQRSVSYGTTVDYNVARALYRNEYAPARYGAGFARPIINRTVEYVGLPTCSTEAGDNDAFLNECFRDYWAPALQQAFRDMMRDSKVVLRFYQPRIDNPLFTSSDRDHGCIEVIPPEMVDFVFDPVDRNTVLQAIVTHFTDVDERAQDEVDRGEPPRLVTHQVIETVTSTNITFFDKTTNNPLPSWSVRNVYGFVNLWPAWNEYSADIGGGQSDLEAVMPFIEAFHDVFSKTLDSHAYHSIPKVKFNVKDVGTFIRNNWPGVVDSDGAVIDGAKIDWKGKEILFFGPEEDGGFIEATSVLGESKTLLDFLIECICIAAETPRWALMSDSTASESAADVAVFTKKIERKRIGLNEVLVMICKMALAANGKTPNAPRFTWPLVNVSDLVSKGQAIQQLILGLDVATAHEWMSDPTAMKILASMFPEMNSVEVESRLALDNKLVDAAPAPASPSQALPQPTKSEPKKALAVTSGSKS